MQQAESFGVARNPHPTTKPINLMRRIIRLTTRPGHTIIDPFSGSSTTGVAAILEGRNYIGIEREAEFVRIGHHRMAQALRDTGDVPAAEALLARGEAMAAAAGLPALEVA